MRIRSIASIVAASFAAATAAHALAIGYVSTFGGELGSPVSYNSAGGTNTISIIGTGQFEVFLPGLGNGRHSNVEVNAVYDSGQVHYCTSGGWFGDGSGNVIAYVDCFDASGNPVTDGSDFALFYQARITAPASGKMAFLWSNQASGTQFSSYNPDRFYNFNSTGGQNTVTFENTGIYFVFLPGLSPHGNPQVTAYNASAGRCEVADWYRNHAGTNVSVYCVNAANVPTNMQFNLSYTEGTLESAGSTATTGAYAWANLDKSKNYVPAAAGQYNALSSPAPLTAQRFSGPQFSLTVPNPDNTSFNTYLGMVTATGSGGEYCAPEELAIPSGEIYMDVACFDAGGSLTRAKYTGTMMFSH